MIKEGVIKEKRWSIKSPSQEETVKSLAKELGVSEFISQLLHQRGITTFNQSKSFFRPTLDELHDPFLMKDMDKAVERVLLAIEKGEKILVYGDYDVDGTTAVSLMYSFLTTIHDQLEYYIPNRYTEGYGVSFQGVDYAAENGFSLIIALDCGIKALDKVAHAKQKGVDFIICDHHRPGDEIPDAVAVLDPKRVDCDYPYKELCGCGVGFKLVQAIATTKNIAFSELEVYFDLLAISIASDIVPITGENRILAHFGLKRVNSNPRKGIAQILEIAQTKGRELTITGLVFTIGPRINAAGRMESGMNAVKLLVSGDDASAKEIGLFIEKENADRKDLDRSITLEGLELIAESEQLTNAKTSVLYNKDWHKGVIGIVASRLIETYYRPTIILTESNGKAAGSARSVSGFDVYEAINSCSDLITQFGGHKYAAGLTMPIENIPAFQEKFEEVVASTIPPELLVPEIKIDAKIDLAEIGNTNVGLPKFYRVIKQFAPFGPQNMTPLFLTENLRAKWVKVVGEVHLKFTVFQEDNPNNTFSCIAFGQGEFYDALNADVPFKMVYVLEENVWNGNTSLQLNVRDIKLMG